MNQKQIAISSLVEMKHYYQSRYEYYLAMATASKENRERVELLIQDLSASDETRRSFWSDGYEFQKSLGQKQTSFYPVEDNSSEYFLEEHSQQISQSPSNLGEELEPESGAMDSHASTDANLTAKTISLFNQAVEIIASIAENEAGKTLHLNYFQKLLEKVLILLPISLVLENRHALIICLLLQN